MGSLLLQVAPSRGFTKSLLENDAQGLQLLLPVNSSTSSSGVAKASSAYVRRGYAIRYAEEGQSFLFLVRWRREGYWPTTRVYSMRSLSILPGVRGLISSPSSPLSHNLYLSSSNILSSIRTPALAQPVLRPFLTFFAISRINLSVVIWMQPSTPDVP